MLQCNIKLGVAIMLHVKRKFFDSQTLLMRKLPNSKIKNALSILMNGI